MVDPDEQPLYTGSNVEFTSRPMPPYLGEIEIPNRPITINPPTAGEGKFPVKHFIIAAVILYFSLRLLRK